MLAIAILAAGKGTRMKSNLPKVLQELCGTTLLERVIESCKNLDPDRFFVIVGHQAEMIKNKVSHIPKIEFVQQSPQRGTGHAIQQLIPLLEGFTGDLLVLNGDVPLLREKTILGLISEHRLNKADVSLLSARLENPKGYGRIISDSQGNIERIIEDRDCNKKELQNNLTNAGVYCFDWNKLLEILPNLSANNDQSELYLTDTIGILHIARHLEVEDDSELSGINDKQQLAHCEQLLQDIIKKHWMDEGVTFIDPSSCTISDNCIFGKDIKIEPQTHICGHTTIGDNCCLGPNCYIKDSTIGDNVNVIYSVINDSRVESGSTIGPFTHLRPNSLINNNCKVGNFVEIKNSELGEASKVNHLSYIGDTIVGEKVNIGAGTITANYDGVSKHKTIIGSQSKTGANSVLVAPLKIGKNVTVGAGSVITKDVPNRSLAISRAKQEIKLNWSKHNQEEES